MSDTVNTMSSPEYRRLSCAQCGRSFARREHLKRHLAVHDSENAYACSTCSKRFTRSDALARHEATHLVSTNGRKQKRFRSCAPCVAAKTRCSSQVPCTRCVAKKIDCHSQTLSPSHSQPAAPYENGFDGNTPPSTQISVGNNTVLGCASPYENVFYTPSSDSTPSASGAPGPLIMSNAVITQQDAIQMQSSPIHMEPPALPHGAEEVAPEHINHTTDITIIRAHISQSTMDLDTALTTSSASASGSSHRSMFDWGINKVPQAKELYIDSYGARLPRRRRASSKRHHNVRPPTQAAHFLMSFPPSRLCSPELEDETLRNHMFMPRETWEEARVGFERCCLTPSPVFPTFSSSHFPSQEDFNIMIAAYFDNFHQILPVVHLPSLSLEPDNWLLALSLAALGAHFVNTASMFDLVNAMHEFLQRALVLAAEQGCSDPDAAALTAKQLHCIGLMFSGNEKNVDRAKRWRADTFAGFKRLCITAKRPLMLDPSRADGLVTAQWLQWVAIEQERRLVYAIWMADSMWRYLLGDESFLSLQMPDVPVPCAEVVWDASSAKQWRQVIEFADVTPTMALAVKQIFMHREVQPTMGEYSRILLIHGLYRHLWHTKSLLDTECEWASASSPREEECAPSPWSTWPPTHISYHKWREAVCDCLDTLHWRANSVIGASSAIEHPTVAHLHLSRIILLTPIAEIKAFAQSLVREAKSSYSSRPVVADTALRERVRAWVEQDRFKARLSIIHAGVTFWHLRRFSVGGYYETHAIVYAALILWAYSLFSERSPVNVCSPDSPGTPAVVSAMENPLPASINLDRPCDDELVQSFIKEGTRIPAMFGGVGDICSPEAPSRILQQAVDVLGRFTNWEVTGEAAQFLCDLSRVEVV